MPLRKKNMPISQVLRNLGQEDYHMYETKWHYRATKPGWTSFITLFQKKTFFYEASDVFV